MGEPVTDGKASDALLKLGKHFTRWQTTDDNRAVFVRADAPEMPFTGIVGAMTRSSDPHMA